MSNLFPYKLMHHGLNIPKFADLIPFRDDVKATCSQMLAHQLPQLLPFESFWNELPNFFDWLEQRLEIPSTAKIRMGANEVPIYAAETISETGFSTSSTMERIRFAASNRQVVDLDYETLDGRRSRRLIEPYSLRRSAEGNLLLYATRNDSGDPRAYRVDRIHGVTITDRTFVPRYTIELTMMAKQRVQPLSRNRGITRSRATQSIRRSRSSRSQNFGPTYVYECSYCGRKFKRKKQNSKLKKHKDKSGWDCPGRSAFHVDTIW